MYFILQKFLELYPDFSDAYINGFRQNSDQYNQNLQKDNELYTEHVDNMKNGELCWRYVKRFGSISKTTVFIDEYGCLKIRGEILGKDDVVETSQFYIHPQEEREIIEGTVLREYIKEKKSYNEMLGELKQYLNFLFQKFSIPGIDELGGLAYDSFPYNCILKENHVYKLFDLEFELKGRLPRAYMIYKCVKTLPHSKQRRAYLDLCEYYGEVANWEYWNTYNFRIWMDTINDSEAELTPENAQLYRKFFI